MYKSKHTKKKNIKRILLLSAIISLMIFVTVGGTIAYITDITDSVDNTFTPSKVTTSVVEDSAGGVMIANTNNTQAYIRAAVVITWQDEQGNVYAATPEKDTDYKMDWTGINDGTWFEGDDGYYYYTVPVDPVPEGETPYTTTTLFSNFEQLSSAPAEGFSLNVEVIGSGIQSTPVTVVEEEWGVNVADDDVTIGK